MEFLGKVVVAESAEESLECLVIPRPEECFDLYERNLISERMRDSYDGLKRMMLSRYPGLRNYNNLYLKEWNLINIEF